MEDDHFVRVSCGSQCRIAMDGRYLLALNRNRRRKEIYELSPIGGGIAVNHLDSLAGFNYRSEIPGSLDLRLMINQNQIEQFRTWFYKRTGRETDPFRELYEELVEEETAVLTNLKREEVRMRFVGVVEDMKETQRQGATGLFTHYFLEIFEVTVMSPDLRLQLQLASPSSGLIWIDENTARRGAPIQLRIDGEERRVTLNTQYLFKK